MHFYTHSVGKLNKVNIYGVMGNSAKLITQIQSSM